MSDPSPRTGIILIGAGGFGRTWVEAIRVTERVACVALVDVNPEALAAAGEALGVPPEQRFTELAPAMELPFDLAAVCVPPAARMPIYRALAEAGKAIVCEKPLAETLRDALAARNLAEYTGVAFVVSQNYRYGDAIQELKSVLASGRFGRPRVAQVDFFKFPRFFGFREEMPYPLLIDMSIHHFDLARFLLEGDPLAVTAASWNPPWSVMGGDPACSLVFEMTGEKRLVYNGSWTTLRPEEIQTPWNGNWCVECEHGCVWMIGDEIRSAHWSLDEAGRPDWEPTDQAEVPHRIPNGQAHVLWQTLEQMAGGATAPTAIDDNVHSLAMVFAAVAAVEQRRRVDVRAMLAE